MLQTACSLLDKAKTAYLTARSNNPLVVTGDFDVKLQLHHQDQPEEAVNACTNGKISIALIDICAVATIFSVISLLAGTFALAGYIVKKLF